VLEVADVDADGNSGTPRRLRQLTASKVSGMIDI